MKLFNKIKQVSASKKNQIEKIICIVIFLIYIIFNIFLLLKHEPWRDEIHPWLLAKNLSIFDLFAESRFDGHPILWALILMPFAKLGFSINTLGYINLFFMIITIWIFLFKIRFPILLKIIFTLTIPFTYTFSVISRNYTLILLLFMIIAMLYDKKEEKPILYSILIALLAHTHSLAWGLVAGLTISFHFSEIFRYLKNRSNNVNIKKILMGLTIIASSSILVVFELFGTSNTNYIAQSNSLVNQNILIMLFMVISSLIVSFICKKYDKECLVLLFTVLMQIVIYKWFYSSILFQRLILIYTFFIFYIILLAQQKAQKTLIYALSTILIIVMCIFVVPTYKAYVQLDIDYPFSGAKEMANYINENINDDIIYCDNATITQALIPYIDNKNLFDIARKDFITTGNVASDYNLIMPNLESFISSSSNVYLIISNDIIEPNLKLIYKTNKAIEKETFSLYYIPEKEE